MKIHLYHGDCLNGLQNIPDNSIDACVTDPPYGLHYGGLHWDYDVPTTTLWKEVLRVLKPGAHLLSFAGSRTYHRMVVAIEDAGFEIRDQILWLYGSGFPKSTNLNGAWRGWGTALKPAHELIALARKPFFGSVVNNVAQYGVGAIHIKKCKVPANDNVPPEGKRSNAKQHRTPAAGRWPANVLHDGLEEDWARYFYCAKVSKAERDAGLEDFTDKRKKSYINTYAPVKNHHPTVKPLALMRYLIRLITPPEGVVLDPFTGSGTTGMAAILEGVHFIGMEREKDYVDIARARMKAIEKRRTN